MGRTRWHPRHVTWSWPRERPSRNVRYYTYTDDDEDGTDSGNDIPITIATENNSSDFSTDLKIERVDTKPQENAVAHHTERFDQVEHGDLIVRRGQPFRIVITFSKPFSQTSHTLSFSFMIGSKPLPGNGTLVSFAADSDAFGDWSAEIRELTGREVEVSVETTADCIVGEWKMAIDVRAKDGRDSAKYTHKKPVYVLFNPWCKKDSVYFPDEDKLSEYILNDSGCIFSGNFRQISATPWFFGQFEEGVLDAAIYCLARACNSRYGRTMSDPVRVSRALSKIINSNDDSGVLVGKWSEPYSGGKAPWSWAGSVAILRQYMNTKYPVKFGQCFVFSGVFTTICRALGLPCRSVTNYCSAHDTDASITIDQHWDINGNNDATIENLDRDSIWNFHCWNDVWMKRPDLPGGLYDGWQVVDATPQEASNGVFQCGPTSITAILNGKCDLIYDAPFVFAEVNADIVHWGREANGEWKVTDIDKTGVGKMISTKMPDGLPMPNCLSDCLIIREDITDQYKYADEPYVVVTFDDGATKKFSSALPNGDITSLNDEVLKFEDLAIGQRVAARWENVHWEGIISEIYADNKPQGQSSVKKAGPKKVANTCKPVANKPLKKRPVHSENPKEKELSGEKNTEQKRGANKPLKKRPVNKENIKDKNTVPTEADEDQDTVHQKSKKKKKEIQAEKNRQKVAQIETALSLATKLFNNNQHVSSRSNSSIETSPGRDIQSASNPSPSMDTSAHITQTATPVVTQTQSSSNPSPSMANPAHITQTAPTVVTQTLMTQFASTPQSGMATSAHIARTGPPFVTTQSATNPHPGMDTSAQITQTGPPFVTTQSASNPHPGMATSAHIAQTGPPFVTTKSASNPQSGMDTSAHIAQTGPPFVTTKSASNPQSGMDTSAHIAQTGHPTTQSASNPHPGMDTSAHIAQTGPPFVTTKSASNPQSGMDTSAHIAQTGPPFVTTQSASNPHPGMDTSAHITQTGPPLVTQTFSIQSASNPQPGMDTSAHISQTGPPFVTQTLNTKSASNPQPGMDTSAHITQTGPPFATQTLSTHSASNPHPGMDTSAHITQTGPPFVTQTFSIQSASNPQPGMDTSAHITQTAPSSLALHDMHECMSESGGTNNDSIMSVSGHQSNYTDMICSSLNIADNSEDFRSSTPCLHGPFQNVCSIDNDPLSPISSDVSFYSNRTSSHIRDCSDCIVKDIEIAQLKQKIQELSSSQDSHSQPDVKSKKYRPRTRPGVEFADYKLVKDPANVPQGYQLMAPGSKIAISSLWLHNTLSSVSRNLEKRQKRAGGHIKKNPNKKRRIIDLDSETIKRLMDGFYDPWELQQHGGTKAFESDERFLALRETARERLAVISASRSALTNRNVYADVENEVTCELVPQDNVLIGSDFTTSVVIANGGKRERTVIGQLSCHSVSYTGVRVHIIKAVKVQATIAPGREQLLRMHVSADEYLDHVTENAAMKISFVGRVGETQQMLTMKDDFRLRIPDLQLKILTEVPRVGSVLKCRVYLKNPLRSKNLTNCSLKVEGPGIKDCKSFRIGIIQAGRDFTGLLDLTPVKPGLRQIYAVFECDELHDVKGLTEVFLYAEGSTVYMG